MGLYRIYRGVGGASSIDWTTPVGTAAAGLATKDLVGLGHVAGVEYWYGIRAVSDAGVEEENTDRIVRVMVDALGNLIGPPPNAITSASLEVVAAGKVRLRAYYSARDQVGTAAKLQVARITAGVADFASPLQEISFTGTKRFNVVLNNTFSDGEAVRLAVRAATTADVGGPEFILNPVTADSTAPSAVEWMEAEQH